MSKQPGPVHITGGGDGQTLLWDIDPPRVVLCAAGDPDPDNNALTVQARELTEYAYSVLQRRGYPNEDLRVLSAYTDPPFDHMIDGDGDGQDDTYGPLTFATLRENLIDWMNEGAVAGRRILLYMNDHGLRQDGETYFNLNGCESISSRELDDLLDELQDPERNGGLKHEVVVVVDCCYSGQFVDTCAPTGDQRRAVIASTSAEDLAVFLPPPDLTSFSHQFFGAAFMGASINDSFLAAKQFFADFQIADQVPELVDDHPTTAGLGIASGFVGTSWLYAGSGRAFDFFGTLGDASVSPEGILEPGTEVTLRVDVTSLGDPRTVFAQVIPPVPSTLAGEPVTDAVETISLELTADRRWEAPFTVEEEGTYRFGIYGRYEGARRSKAEVVQVSVSEEDPEETRPLIAMIVAGQDDPTNQSGAIDNQALELTARSFLSATTRGYEAADIKVYGPNRLASLGTNIPEQPMNIEDLNDDLAELASAHPGAKLFISLIGPVDPLTDDFQLEPGITLSPEMLDLQLDALETADPMLDTIILIDTPQAGLYLDDLNDPDRFVIVGTDEHGEGFFLPETNQSFSRRFLEAARQGRDLFDSWRAGQKFASLFELPEPRMLDGENEFLPRRAMGRFLGRRGVFASDAGELAVICTVAPDQEVDIATHADISAILMSGLQPEAVTVQAFPDTPEVQTLKVNTFNLTQDATNPQHWYLPDDLKPRLFSTPGPWLVSYEVRYPSVTTLPRTSQARVSRINVLYGENAAIDWTDYD